MTGWVLRWGEHETALEVGTHLVGRDPDCLVRLDDDGLASRRHAEIVVDVDGVSVRDLGSRNGVFLRYRRLEPHEEARLFHGDTCLVGATNLVLLRKRTRRLDTIDMRVPSPSSHPPEPTGSVVLYEKFLADADRASAKGDHDACATATHLLLELLGDALSNGRSDEAALASATRHALRLAELRGVEWIDQLLALYDRVLLVPTIETVTTMQRLFGANAWRSERLDGYVTRIGPVLSDAGPRGRALLGQLEALRRLQAR